MLLINSINANMENTDRLLSWILLVLSQKFFINKQLIVIFEFRQKHINNNTVMRFMLNREINLWSSPSLGYKKARSTFSNQECIYSFTLCSFQLHLFYYIVYLYYIIYIVTLKTIHAIYKYLHNSSNSLTRLIKTILQKLIDQSQLRSSAVYH